MSRLVVNVTWTDLLFNFNSPITQPGLNSEEGGLQVMGSSGRITISGDDCSVIGKGGSEGVRRGWKVSSPTSGGRSVGIVRSRTQVMEFYISEICWVETSNNHASIILI
jgi:hypothetical protein